MSPSADFPVLFFDGVCNLCNSSVQFVLRHDGQKKIRFASLQSIPGQKAIEATGNAMESLVFLKNGTYYTGSTAALKVAAMLDAPWKWWSAMLIIPKFIRDFFYRVVARNRYRWFGKKDACMIPSPELRARFLSA